MALLNRKSFCLGILLLLSSLSHANSNQNIYSMTISILSYVKWSHPKPNFCIVDNNNITDELSQAAALKQTNLNVINVSSSNIVDKKCESIFLSNKDPATEQKIINSLKVPPALSFSTNNSDCEIGSVFCLYSSKSGKSLFKVNLDSLAKTKIHIDPRVLLLAQQAE